MSDWFNVTAELFSGVAVVFSGYSLWQTSLKKADIKLFVPPLIRYASPYQNSVFEVFEIPITMLNEGAKTGTILSFELYVTNAQTHETKQFYSGGTGSWSLAKARNEGLHPFAPIAITGRSNENKTVLFYSRHDSHVQQIANQQGDYDFKLVPITALHKVPHSSDGLEFRMHLPILDHRAFTSGDGTLPLNHPNWQATATA